MPCQAEPQPALHWSSLIWAQRRNGNTGGVKAKITSKQFVCLSVWKNCCSSLRDDAARSINV